jgi:hypothetical protein
VGLTFRLGENLLLTPQIATESTLVIGQLDPIKYCFDKAKLRKPILEISLPLLEGLDTPFDYSSSHSARVNINH